MRIALAGSHSVGKSTLLAALDIPGHKKVQEVARRVIERFGKLPYQMNEREFFDFQWTVAKEQLAAETGDFIADRSIYDNLAYSQDLPDYDKIAKMVLAEAKPYDYVFYIPIEFGLKADDVRKPDEAYQQLIDIRIKKILNDFGIKYIEVRGSTEERVAKIKSVLKI